MRINNNLMAINTHRQLGISANAGAKSMEKLSSGLRINRAGDDAAGLAISEKMRGQIRGLNQASRNSADTISLIQTAEGALNETHAILQRMRELANQSANDTNTASDRTEIQAEIDQLIKEVDRIGNTTEFNTKKLLDGSAVGISDSVAATVKVNGNSAVAINVDLLNAFTEGVNKDSNFYIDGALTLTRVNQSEGATEQVENDYKLIGPDGKEYSFSKTVSGGKDSILTEDTGTITDVNIRNALATANVTTAGALTNTHVTKVGKGTVLAKGSKIQAGSSGITITVNNANIKIETGTGTNAVKVGDVNVADGESITLKDGTVLKNNAGVLNVEQGSVTLAAQTDVSASSTEGVINIAANSVLAGGSTTSNGTVYHASTAALAAGSVINYGDISGTIKGSVTLLDQTGAALAVSGTSTEIGGIAFGGNNTAAGLNNLEDRHILAASFSDTGVGLSTTFAFSKYQAGSSDLQNSFMTQAGANSGQGMFVSMNDMRAKALGIEGLDISTRYGATQAMTTLDNAIQKVSHQRAVLGAVQNRLEHTIKNLDTSAENLQAAESRVRDVDMAKEIMENTKQNILQQASQAMLAQANQAPQSVLQLLR